MSKDTMFVNLAENYARPPVKEDKYRGFVLNGDNNSFFQDLISAYKGSTTHSSICKSYINMIWGRGLNIAGEEYYSKANLDFKEVLSDKDSRAMVTDYQILGAFAGQVHLENGGSGKVAKIEHLDVSKLAPSIRNEKGQITSYWYSYDWEKEYEYPPKEYKVVGFGDKNSGDPEIFVCQPYAVGGAYFTDPAFMSALPYAQLEEEISNFSITHIKRGLSFGNIIGVPNSSHWTETEKTQYTMDLKQNGTGSSNAGGTQVVFLTGNEPINISNVENNTSHKQWDLLTKESKLQILTAHQCTSPSIIGMPPSTGFSSSAEEMDKMEEQLNKRVIIPVQEWFAACIEDVFKEHGQEFDLTLIPLIDEDEKEAEDNDETIEKEVEKEESEEKLSEISLLDEFIAKGEVIDRFEYDVINEVEVDYDEEVELDNALAIQEVKLSLFEKITNLVSTGTARPNAKSKQDSDDIIIRYKYVGAKTGERDFCNKMIAADKVYRKEDILQLTNKPVNKGFGKDGADTYSIWLYKGGGLLSKSFPGGTCKHKWNRVIYLKKGKNVDVNSPLAKTISTSEARRRGYKVPTNESKVSIAPHDVK